ncbi:nitroreductase family protein [Candidatus Zixiibacteriota bacterium]
MKKLTPWIFTKNLFKILRGRPQIPESLAENKLLQTILNRRSIRSFLDQDIPADIWAAILEAGRMAPSTVNLQTWSFCTFNEQQWQSTFEKGIPFGGKRAIVVLGDVSRIKEIIDIFPNSPLVEYTVAVLNTSLAAMNMNIAAEALGISSVMLSETGKSGFFTAKHLQESLHLPSGVFPLMTIVFGYSKQPFAPLPPRLPMDQICASGKYPVADVKVLEDWLLEMKTAFKTARPLWSFEGQLRKYRDDIERAEEELKSLVYRIED